MLKQLTLAAAVSAAAFFYQPTATARSPSGATAIVLADAVVFRGSELAGKEHLDIYITVPYQSIEFHEYDDRFAAQYKATVVIRDLVGRRLLDSSLTRSMVTDDYAQAHGSSGSADNFVLRFPMAPGDYRYEIIVDDLFSQREFELSDTVKVPDLSYTPAMSSIMYISQIEQRGSRFKITPYVGTRIWNPDTQLFAFFEVYEDKLPQDYAFTWSVVGKDNKELGQGQTGSSSITDRSTRQFFPLRGMEQGLPGEYQLIVKMHPLKDGAANTSVVLAERIRDYIIPRTLQGSILSDLDLAIRQLAYVADQDQIDVINGAADANERRVRFESFWNRLDPSPATARNEAFDEYYRRITASNLRFKSYAQGWETDMGRIYIIYGEPQNVERITGTGGNATLIRWAYSNSVTFTFEDSSGFGDYRLRTPLSPMQKYRYRP